MTPERLSPGEALQLLALAGGLVLASTIMARVVAPLTEGAANLSAGVRGTDYIPYLGRLVELLVTVIKAVGAVISSPLGLAAVAAAGLIFAALVSR